MSTIVTRTENDNFIAALKYALAQGQIIIDMRNFRGWVEECSCAGCRSQRIVYDFLFSDVPCAIDGKRPICEEVENERFNL